MDAESSDAAPTDASMVGIDRAPIDFGTIDLGSMEPADPCSVPGGAEVVFEPRPEFNNWFFGYHAGLSFASGSPTPLAGGAITTAEGVASISDHDGNLLFYTDGQTIWNRMHAEMENGTGLTGHVSSTQSGVIVPVPGSDHEYFVFATGAEENSGGASYSIVDMTLAGGLGAVTSVKNVELVAHTSEKLVAARHHDGVNYWIITHDIDSNCFRTWLATADGVDVASPVVSCTGVFLADAFWSSPGQMKLNRSGRTLAAAYVSLRDGAPGAVSNMGAVELYDFNDETGEVTNAHSTIWGNQPYGVEFSPAGTRLYATFSPPVALYQVDLCASDPAATATAIVTDMPGAHGLFESLQLGPDSRVYMTASPGSGGLANKISVITHPDRLGDGAEVMLDAVGLGTGTASYGLPNFIQFYARPDDIILY